MLRLDATTRSLEVVLGGAVSTTEAAFLTNWADGATTSYAGGATPGVTSGATPVTMVAAPGSGLIRDVDYVSVRNQDTAEITATVRYNDNSTIYPIIAATLAVGDQLVYTHANGWSVFRLDGSVKSGTTGPQGDPGADGMDGSNGSNGTNGTNGVDGVNGSPGQDVVGGYDSFDEDGLALSYCGAGVAVSSDVTTGGLLLGTMQATTSGSTKDFTIPAGVKFVMLSLIGVSTNGSAAPGVQLGDAGGVEATGYVGEVSTSVSGDSSAFSTAFLIQAAGNASHSRSGIVTLALVDSATNLWSCSFTLGNTAGVVNFGGGYKALSQELTTVRLVTTDTFDAGNVNVLYQS